MAQAYNLYYAMRRLCLFPIMIAEWFIIAGLIIGFLHYLEERKEQRDDINNS